MTKDYLIDSHKMLWHLERVLKWQNNELVAPIYVEISPTSYCNQKCIFCGVDFVRNSGRYLSDDKLCKCLEEMSFAGVKSVMFAGEGEPFLHKSLPLFVKSAKISGIDVAITTNGSITNDHMWNDVLPYLTWIRFSVDAGSREVYSRVHQTSGDVFNKVLDNIKLVQKNKMTNNLNTTVGVQYLIVDENLDDIQRAIEIFSDLEIDYIVFKPYSLHPRMLVKRNYYYSEETIKRLEKIIDETKNYNKTKIIFRLESLQKYMLQIKEYSHCYALPFWAYISSNGDIYTCSVHLYDDDFYAGNIYREDIHEIFFGNKRKKSINFARYNLDVNVKCRINCRMARINEFLGLLSNPPEHVNFI